MSCSRVLPRRSTFHLSGLFLLLLAATAPAGDGSLLNTPPEKPVRIPAEFEPTQAVIANWANIDDKDFFRYIAEDIRLILLWDSPGRYEEMVRHLPTYGVNMDNCEFYKVSSLPYTPRDFLPWFLFIDHNEPAFVFNQAGTPQYGLEQGYSVYHSGLHVQGGDFMTDGRGTAVSLEGTAAAHAEMGDEFLARVRDYWGVHTYHFISNPKMNEGNSPHSGDDIPPHIDCMAKFLSRDTVMVVRYPSSDPLHARSEAAAAYFRRHISCYGTPYKVVRLDSPDKQPYVNSLIVNHRVFVPILDNASDAVALATYKAVMPGYEVIAVNNRGVWNRFWALHCDTMGIPDEQMLYIEHTPLRDRPPAFEGFPIRAEIEAYSGTEFVEGTPIVLWRTPTDVNESQPSTDWNAVVMARDTASGDHRYLAYIPAQPVGTVVEYYLQAKDASGRDETHPCIGRPQAHAFTVTTLGANVSAVSARRGGTIEFYINAGADKAGRPYHLAYSASADPNNPESPGVALPETTVLTGFDAALDDFGIGAARLTFPEPLASEWVGRVLRFSLESGDPQSDLPDTVSIQILE